MRKLAIFSAAFTAAAAFFVYVLRDVRALWIAGVCLVLCPVMLKLGLRRLCAVFLGLTVGLLWCFGYHQLFLAPAERLYDTEQTLTVTLTEAPASTIHGSRALAELNVQGRTYGAVLYANELLLEASAGDRVTAQMSIEPTGLSVTDGESLYDRSYGVIFTLFAESEPEIENGSPVWTVQLRQKLQDRIHARYHTNAAGLLRALLTGDRSELSYAVQNDLSVAGLRHAVAVSGMHVTMLMAMVSLCCGHNPRLTALLGIPVVVLFVLMTGASPSACRAAVMQIMLLTAPLIRREQDTLTALAFAALVLLLQNPWAIASVSFQLSFSGAWPDSPGQTPANRPAPPAETAGPCLALSLGGRICLPICHVGNHTADSLLFRPDLHGVDRYQSADPLGCDGCFYFGGHFLLFRQFWRDPRCSGHLAGRVCAGSLPSRGKIPLCCRRNGKHTTYGMGSSGIWRIMSADSHKTQKAHARCCRSVHCLPWLYPLGTI